MIKKLIKSKTSYRHGNLKEAILEASLKLMAAKGVENLSIREAAELVGVTHQAPYRHFKDREALLIAIALDGLEKLDREIHEHMTTAKDPIGQILKFAEAYFQFATLNPDQFRLIFSKATGHYHPEASIESAFSKGLIGIASLVSTAQSANQIGKGDPHKIARQFWAAIHGVTVLFIDDQFRPLIGNTNAGSELVVHVCENLARGTLESLKTKD